VAERNRKAYESADVAGFYTGADGGVGLLEEERAILDRYAAGWAGKSLLDLGVGGGRTTPHFRAFCGRYVGVDYVEEMVRQCRERFPGVDFRLCDARDLRPFGDQEFDVAWFPYNGIDYVSIEDRSRVLAEVRRVLRPGGAFAFSSHNLAAPAAAPGLRPPLVFDPNPLRLARRNLAAVKSRLVEVLNYRRNKPYEVAGAGYEFRVDAAHGFRLLTCYVCPSWQIGQLEAQGFRDVTLFGKDGSLPGPDPDTTEPWVHYVAFKSDMPPNPTGPSPCEDSCPPPFSPSSS
jgi:SAM-dependent methyltransferase